MSQIEKTFITSRLVDALQDATGLITPEDRYRIYQDCMRLLAVLLKGARPIEVYRELFPGCTFTELQNGMLVVPPSAETLTRREAIDWRNRLLAEGLGELTLFRVQYAHGGFVEYAGESDESKVLDQLLADWGYEWKVFRGANDAINLVLKSPLEHDAARMLAESMAARVKERYPFEVIVVRVPLEPPVEGLDEVRVAKR